MPKPIALRLEVEELYVGPIMRQLHNMKGVASINFDLGTPKHQKELNGGSPKKFQDKAEDFIASLLMKDPMPTNVIRQHFEDVGRKQSSTASALNLLKTNGDIKKMPDGKTWMLTKKARDRMYKRAAAAKK